MVKSNWPLTMSVTAGLTADNQRTVKVFAYEIVRSQERFDGEFIRLEETLKVYAPVDSFSQADMLWLDSGTRWKINGGAEDNNNNPFWSPGLVVYYAERQV